MSGRLRQALAPALAGLEGLSLRERILVLGATLLVLAWVGYTLLLAPQRAQLMQARAEVQRERGQLSVVEAGIAEIEQALQRDPNAAVRLRLQQLAGAMAAFGTGLQRLEDSLVAPEAMAPLLERALQRMPGVQVVAMQTLPVRGLPERETDQRTSERHGEVAPSEQVAGQPPDVPGAASEPALYRHAIELTVRGGYPDLMRYLAHLERLPQRIYFGQAELHTTKLPEMELRLILHTLGVSRSWLAL